MKLNKRSVAMTAAMVGCFVLLGVCARVTEKALPANSPFSQA